MRSRSVHMVADIFPPVHAVGVHRSVALCRHLVEQGWTVTVITARPKGDAALDEALLDGVPEEVRVVRTAAPNVLGTLSEAFRSVVRRKQPRREGASEPAGGPRRTSTWRKAVVDWLTWWLHVPDSKIGWLLPAVWAGIKEARRRRPDVIFSTAPVWTSHLVGMALSRLLHVPWVADFRDPWCGSHWRSIPYEVHRRIDASLERCVIGTATRITCAWEGIRKHLSARHTHRAQDMVTVLNGFDAEQIDGVPAAGLNGGRCVLVHCGTFYGPRSPVPLFKGMGRLLARSPGAARRLLVALVGEPTYDGRDLLEYAEEEGVASLVRIMSVVPHRKAIAVVKGADVALLFGQSGGGPVAPVPAKTYEYIGAGKGVLGIDVGKEACEVIQRGGCRLWQASEDPRSVAAALASILEESDRRDLRRQTNWEARMAFTRSDMARSLERVLLEAMDSRGRRKAR